ncbi:MAG: hypothetical protein P8J51_03910 [Dehalococcoidia bacterium]|nr:hypothetical protein [Dehalococcoidia bacterium]
MKQKKILTIDFDGVICGTPYPFKLGINKKSIQSKILPKKAIVPPKFFREPLDKLRYAFRPILPDTHNALELLFSKRELVLLTGRRSSPKNWLKNYNIEKFFTNIIFNNTKDNSSHYKLNKIIEIGANEHIDDDAHTIHLLSELTQCKLFLRNWKYNEDYSLNNKITRVSGLHSLSKIIDN